jgi:hypothetical protein
MKIVRRALVAFMAFFCVIGAIPLVPEIREAVRSFGDPGADTSRAVVAVVVRLTVCVFFAWLALATWRKNSRSENAR